MENYIVAKWAANRYASLSYNKMANPISYHEQYLPYYDGFVAAMEYVKFKEWQRQVYSFRPNWKNYIKIGHAANRMTIPRKTYSVAGNSLTIGSEILWFGGSSPR